MVYRAGNTTRTGSSFKTETVEAVWQKGQPLHGHDPDVWRLDRCGALINRDQYGDRKAEYGWEVDHMKPVAVGGSDDLANLQPLHWRNNVGKGDDYPNWYCTITL